MQIPCYMYGKIFENAVPKESYQASWYTKETMGKFYDTKKETWALDLKQVLKEPKKKPETQLKRKNS